MCSWAAPIRFNSPELCLLTPAVTWTFCMNFFLLPRRKLCSSRINNDSSHCLMIEELEMFQSDANYLACGHVILYWLSCVYLNPHFQEDTAVAKQRFSDLSLFTGQKRTLYLITQSSSKKHTLSDRAMLLQRHNVFIHTHRNQGPQPCPPKRTRPTKMCEKCRTWQTKI